MPIDYGNLTWPPAECDYARPFYQEWGAWYRGDMEQLSYVYGGQSDAVSSQFFGSDTATSRWPGARRLLSNFWHGRPQTPGQNTTRLHIPAARDVSRLNGSMLYAEPPAFTIPDGDNERANGDSVLVENPGQDRLEDILEDGGVYSVLREQAEQGSAYGGMFVRASVDIELADYPIVDALIPDNAIPTWRRGILVGVTFWREVRKDGKRIWRHLELHETIGKVGYIEHALYLGEPGLLGEKVPLEDGDAECQHAATLVDAYNRVVTGCSVLDVVYQPNVRPHPMLRGTALGCSDYFGATSAMDALDETWSSWMRDIRLAKGRMVVPRAYLQSGGAGRGASFDLEQEIFTGIEMMGGKDQGMQLSQVQFAIRVDEHERTANACWRTIAQAAGLSRDAFGEQEGGGDRTAKEVGKASERSTGTRLEKQGYQTPGLRRLGFILQELDVAHLGGTYTPLPVQIEWHDQAAVDPESQARTLQLLDAAKAVSTKTKVEMLHPDWTETDIDREVVEIDGAPVEDPTTFGTNPLADPFGAPAPDPVGYPA